MKKLNLFAVAVGFGVVACGTTVDDGPGAAESTNSVAGREDALAVVGVYKIKNVATSNYVVPFANGLGGYSLTANANQATAFKFTAIQAADGRYNLCENGTSTSQLCAVPAFYIAVSAEPMDPRKTGHWIFANAVGDTGEIENPYYRALWTASTMGGEPVLTTAKRMNATTQKWKLELQ